MKGYNFCFYALTSKIMDLVTFNSLTIQLYYLQIHVKYNE